MKWYFKKCPWAFLLLTSWFAACEKDTAEAPSAAPVQFEFGIVGQLFPTIKSENSKLLDIIIPQDSAKASLKSFCQVPVNVKALLNNANLLNQQTVSDYSGSIQLSLVSGNGVPQNWTVRVRTESEAYGLGSTINAAKSLNKSYNYYLDQKTTGKFASENCGPSVATMVVHWVDQAFTKSAADARSAIKPGGGAWSTSDVMHYLDAAQVESKQIYLSNLSQKIKKYIDLNCLLILCLDMDRIAFNADPMQKTNKFYITNHAAWGHYVLVKGYRVVDGQFFAEVYDPNSFGKENALTHELMGKDRYYAADQLKLATEDWWKYAIVVAPKGVAVADL